MSPGITATWFTTHYTASMIPMRRILKWRTGHVFEDDGRTCIITLRPGLAFHDGERVRAADAVASLLRWIKRNAAGQYLAANLVEATALDDRRLRLRLQRGQPSLIASLASATSPVLFVMPERIARTDPFTQISETIGSGALHVPAGRVRVWESGSVSAQHGLCPYFRHGAGV